MTTELKQQLKTLIHRAKDHERDENELLAHYLSVKKVLSICPHHLTGKKMVFLNKRQPYYLLGDLHSDESTLLRFLEHIDFYGRAQRGEIFQVIFLGDYVDRGTKPLELLALLINLSISYPQHVCLLRGNHDGGVFNDEGGLKLPYRVPEEDDPLMYFPHYMLDLIAKDNNYDIELLELFFEWFDSLPLIAFVGNESGAIQCVHGGLIKPSFDETEHYNDIYSLADLTLTLERRETLFWSDPYSGSGDRYLERKRFKFTMENYLAYKAKLDIDALIRGHEVVLEGVRTHFDGTLYTLFSSGASSDSYYKEVTPKYMLIDTELNLTVHSIW